MSESSHEESVLWGSGTNSGYNSGEDHFSFSSSSESDLEPIDGQEVRKITQLHCTKWPGAPSFRRVACGTHVLAPLDFGVPESAQVMKDLVYELELRKRRHEDPIIVHCSAGIGRTGSCLLFRCLRCAHASFLRNFCGHSPGTAKRPARRTHLHSRHCARPAQSAHRYALVVRAACSVRDRCAGMVQSKEQYVFLYGVVSEMLRDRDSLLSLRSRKYKRLSYMRASPPASFALPASCRAQRTRARIAWQTARTRSVCTSRTCSRQARVCARVSTSTSSSHRARPSHLSMYALTLPRAPSAVLIAWCSEKGRTFTKRLSTTR